MRSFLALDLSLRSTGYAVWSEGQPVPTCGTWELAGSPDHAARAFVRLHKHLMAIHAATPLEAIAYEEPLPHWAVKGNTSIATLAAAAGLAAHVQSFGEALGIRHSAVNLTSWRRSFIGKLPRGTKTPDLKAMAMRRCRELGFDVLKHDAAEAAGLLDYQLTVEGIIPPWRAEFALTREYAPAFDGAGV